MYEFWYQYLKPKYKDKVKLLYMDTDSFVLEIETDDFHKDTKDDFKEWFGTSKYSKDMVLPEEYRRNASVNKKVIGKIKDELHKGYMREFIALSPKIYAYEQVKVDKTLSVDKNPKLWSIWKAFVQQWNGYEAHLWYV